MSKDRSDDASPLAGEASAAHTARLADSVGQNGPRGAFALTLLAAVLLAGGAAALGERWMAAVPIALALAGWTLYLAVARPAWNDDRQRAEGFEELKRSTDPEALLLFFARLDQFSGFEDVSAQTVGHVPFVLRVLDAHPKSLTWYRKRLILRWLVQLRRDGHASPEIDELWKRASSG